MISAIRNEKKSPQGPLPRRQRCLKTAALLFLAMVFATGSVAAASVSTGGKTIELNFKNTPVDAVLEYLSEAAGVVVVSDINLTDRITVISKTPLDIDEALSLINSILQEKGYTTVRNGRVLKVATLADAKKMNLPVSSGDNPKDIVPSDEVVTHIIPLRHAKAVSLQKSLSSLVSSTADFSANADTNTLIVTDTKANIRRLVEIVSKIDNYMAAVADVKVFHLKFADASDTATLINNIFGEQSSNSSSSGNSRVANIMRMMRQRGGPGGTQTQTQSSSSEGTVTATVTAKADDRTNSVVVSAPEDTMSVIERVIKDLDSNSTQGEGVFVYHLKNGKASDLVTVLNELFNESYSSGTRTTGTTAQREETNFRSSSSSSSTSSSDTLAGEVTFQADKDSNSLIVLTTQADYEKVKKMLDQLDKPVPQVLIRVLIAEVTHENSSDVGAEFSFLDNWKDNGTIQMVTSGTGRLGDISSSYIADVVDTRFDAKLKALEEQNKLDILSKPYILATNNQEASITVGSEVPFITASRTTDTGQTVNTIQYEDIGIILTVTPYINEEGQVTMDVSQEISALSSTTVPISDTVSAPVIAKRSSSDRVIARNGQTVVIGGLMENTRTATVDKIPLLGDIPILGGVFRRKQNDKTKTELLIFLTPTIASTNADIAKILEKEKGRKGMVSKTYSSKQLDISADNGSKETTNKRR